jgi:pyruvate dehydrogenase E1 component
LLGSGAILTEVVQAAQMLADKGIYADVISVTSWSELARDGSSHPGAGHLHTLLEDGHGPVIAASDYVRAVPESVRAFIPGRRPFHTLGTDGFGRSDTRAVLRRFFQVDAQSIARLAVKVVNGSDPSPDLACCLPVKHEDALDRTHDFVLKGSGPAAGARHD